MSSDCAARNLQCVQDSIDLLVGFGVHRGGLEATVVDELRQLVDSGREQFGGGAQRHSGLGLVQKIKR